MTPTCTRRLEFDAGHRVLRHESKCRHPHGHRYRVDVTCRAAELDEIGRVIDFGEIKALFGAWIDEALDHGYIAHPEDEIGKIFDLGVEGEDPFKVFVMPPERPNPTAENIVVVLAEKAQELLGPRGIEVVAVRLFETPNCWADWTLGEGS